jgi:hypothetical protein
MARFLAEVEGSRKPAHRLGHASSGIRAQAQGWDLGVKVHGNAKPLDADRDMFEVFVTGGSNYPSNIVKIGTVQRTSEGGIRFTLSDDMARDLQPEFQSCEI